MFAPVLFVIICYVSEAITAKIGPCTKDDMDCLKESLNSVIEEVNDKYKLDPLTIDYMSGEVEDLEFRLYDTQINGIQDCSVDDINFEKDETSLQVELLCTSFKMAGEYESEGSVYNVYVPGDGYYEIVTDKYRIKMDAEMKKIDGDDGYTYINIDSYELEPEAQGPIKFFFENLFVGQRGQEFYSEIMHNYAHENWKKVSDDFQLPIFEKAFDIITTAYNDFLKTQPMEEMFEESD